MGNGVKVRKVLWKRVIGVCWQSPRPPQIQSLAKKTQNSAQLFLRLHLIRAKRCRANHKRKRCMVRGRPGASLQERSAPRDGVCSAPPAGSWDDTCGVSPGAVHLSQGTWGFYWESFPRHSLPSMYQNSRLPGGKPVFSTHHIVCINSLDTVNYSYQGLVKTFPKSKLLDTSQGGSLVSRLFQE